MPEPPVSRPRMAGLALLDLPGAVRLAAGRAVGLLALAADHNGLLELAAEATRLRLVRAHRHDRAVVAGVWVLPLHRLVGRRAFQRGLGAAVEGRLVGAVERGADRTTQQTAQHHAQRRRRDLARAMTQLRAGQAAEAGTDQGAAGGLVQPRLARRRIALLPRLGAGGKRNHAERADKNLPHQILSNIVPRPDRRDLRQAYDCSGGA